LTTIIYDSRILVVLNKRMIAKKHAPKPAHKPLIFALQLKADIAVIRMSLY